MILFFVLLVVFFIFFFWIFYNEFTEKSIPFTILICLLSLLLGGIGALMLSACANTAYNKNKPFINEKAYEYNVETKKIYSLNININNTETFVLGTNGSKYCIIIKDENGIYQLKEIDTKDVMIIYTDDEERYAEFYTHKDYKIASARWFSFGAPERVKIYIPYGSILENYNLIK